LSALTCCGCHSHDKINYKSLKLKQICTIHVIVLYECLMLLFPLQRTGIFAIVLVEEWNLPFNFLGQEFYVVIVGFTGITWNCSFHQNRLPKQYDSNSNKFYTSKRALKENIDAK
jgi:hypothetical protein